MNPTQGKKKHRKSTKIRSWLDLLHFFELMKCDQSNTDGATVPLRRWDSAGSTEPHRLNGESSHLQNEPSWVLDGQNAADVVLHQQLLISCICPSEEMLTSLHILLHPIYIQRSRTSNANLRFFSPATALLQTVRGERGLLAKRFGFLFFFGLNWKKNRKTNVSKTVQQLGPKARNWNCSNQILFFKRKPFFLLQTDVHFALFFLMFYKFGWCAYHLFKIKINWCSCQDRSGR